MRGIVAGAAVALVVLGAVAFQIAVVAKTGFQAGDFRAFYCAARVTAQGADPYRTQPLHACEVSNGSALLFQNNPSVTVPAPLPGYAIAAVLPFARLPFVAGAVTWLILLALATAAAAALLAPASGVAWPITLAALGLSAGMASIPFGEIVPIAIGGICACAYFASTGRWWAAAASAAVAMIEPHLGLPVCVAIAVWSPKARVPTVVSLAALGIVSIATLGLTTNLEYLVRVLPAHALSEAARDTQFSLTALLTSMGVTDTVAARMGFAEYLLMVASGTYVAGVLARRFQNDAFLACVPPAFAVFGGTFIHVTQIAAAIPATVLFLAYVEGRRRTVAVVALLLLSVPWIMAWSPVMGIAPAFPIAFLTWQYWRDVRVVVVSAVVCLLLLVGLNRALAADARALPMTYAATAIDGNYAEASWREFARTSSTGSLAAWIVRIPTWAALAALLSLTALAAKAAR